MSAAPCEVTLRWDVLGVSEGIATVRLNMDGWDMEDVRIRDKSIWDESEAPLFVAVAEALNADHDLRVDLATWDVILPNGTYVGRWGFHLSSAEVAAGRTEVTRNWYNGTVIEGNVDVTKEVALGMEDVLAREYGVDTFARTQTGWIQPLPEGLERWIYNLGGGWTRLFPSGPVHDAASSLLLATPGKTYSDLLFRLYGILWLESDFRIAPDAVALSSIALVDTNLIPLPGRATEDTGPGEEEGEPGEGTPEVSPDNPWPTLGLFAAAAAVAAVLAYRWFRPARSREDAGEEETWPSSGDRRD
ncbi:MAG: hypothetical protein V3U30_03230 [Thermoplasmata archaeon]